MKKTLVALAALASISAFAQSTVTISGNVDLGIQTTKETGYNKDANGDWNDTASTRKQSAPKGNGAQGWTSSALGLDVTEDLGAGTTAGYSVAIDLNSWAATNDGGAGTNGYFQNTRHSFLKLGNANMGEVRLGYQYTLDDQIQGGVGRATPTGNIAGRVQNSALTVTPTQAAATAAAPYREGYETISTGSFTRNNGVQYATPVMNGFQGLAQWAQQKDDKDTSAAQAGKATSKISALAAKYSSGPLNLGMAHTTIKNEGATAGANNALDITTKTKMTDLAANYDFGVAKVFANKYSRKTDVTAGAGFDGDMDPALLTSSTATVKAAAIARSATAWGAFQTGGSLKRTGWDLGVSAPFGKTTLFASLGRGKNKYDMDGSGDVSEVKIKGKLLGATYDLSKRTSLNAYYGMVKATGDDEFVLKKTQTGFGLRHSF